MSYKDFKADGFRVRMPPMKYIADVVIYKIRDKAVAETARGEIIAESEDHAEVIQKAVNYVKSLGGGKVFIKNGEYRIAKEIAIEAARNVVIEGEGWNTKLVAADKDTIIIRIGSRTDVNKASQKIVIRNIFFDGSEQETETKPPEYNDRRFGIEIASPYDYRETTTEILIEGCYFYNTGSDAVYGYEAGRVIVTGCWFEKIRGYWAAVHCHDRQAWIIVNNVFIDCETAAIRHGAVIANNVAINCKGRSDPDNGVIVTGCHLGGSIVANNHIQPASGYDGIYVFGIGDHIIGNIIIGGRKGIRFRSASGYGWHTVVGNFIRDTSDRAIDVTGGNHHNTIRANHIRNTKGIYIDSNNIDVEGNYMDYCGDSSHDYITLGPNASENTIRNNVLVNDRGARAGIYEESGADNNVIINNVVLVGTERIVKSGSNTIVKNNVGYLTENSGVATLSGDGSTTDFLIGEHGLSPTIDDPSKVVVKCTPASADAIAASPLVCYLSDENSDGNYESIRVKFSSAPPSGTDNVKVAWEVEYIG